MSLAYAIIPARGGSKRIPRKNIKLFCGQPIIQRVIDAAHRSGLFERIIVSTDDTEIAGVALAGGAEVPFIRSTNLADDYTGTTEVIRDVVQQLELAPEVPVCCLYATAVFATSDNLRQGYEALASARAKWSFSVVPFRAPIQRAYRRLGDMIVPFEPHNMPKRSQDLEKSFSDAGQFYWATAATWADADAHVWDGAVAVEIDSRLAMDIDTPEDWKYAEFVFQGILETKSL